jgi:DnaK suppressor protein
MDEALARTRLTTRLAELKGEDRIGEDAQAPVDLQQDSVGRLSRMDAMQQQAMAQATQRRRDAEKLRIGAALRRLDDGEWGWCATCGEDIAEARLEHDPSVTQCVACASGSSG